MRALENLTLGGVGVISQAGQFGRHACLKALDMTGVKCEAGALPLMASSAVEHLKIAVDTPSDADVATLLANRTLRSLGCKTAYHAVSSAQQAIALAGYPTRDALHLTRQSQWS